MRISVGFVLLWGLFSPGDGRADDRWPEFRGPTGQGHAAHANPPIYWSEKSNIRWQASIPGEGHSSPVIDGNEVWLTTAVIEPLTAAEKDRRLSQVRNPRNLELAGPMSLRAVCLDRQTGRMLHNLEIFRIDEPEPKHSLNSYASPTPVIFDEVVVVHFGTYGTAALRRDSPGIAWKTSEFRIDHQNGPGSSPVRYQDSVIIHFDGMDLQFIAALDALSGDVLWKTDRSGEMNPRGEMKKAYCTPLVIRIDGRDVVISPAADWVYAYDAGTGEELWKISYGNLGFSTVPRPVYGQGRAFIATSFMKSRVLAIRPNGKGDATETHIDWMTEKGAPQKPSLLLSDDRLYLLNDKGILRCVNAATGDEYWVQRLSGEFSASPLLADGRIYLCGHNGRTTVIADSTEYQELAVNELDSDIMASPAAIGDRLFIRTATRLYCIRDTPTAGSGADE